MIKRLFLALSLIGMMLIAAPPPAMAYDFFHSAGCGQPQASSTAVCTEKGNKNNPLTGCPSNCGDGLLMKITNIIAYVAGAAAVILIIIGAIRYVTSGSDTSVGNRIDDDVLNAKRTISNAMIGLAIIVLAKTIITYVLNKVT